MLRQIELEALERRSMLSAVPTAPTGLKCPGSSSTAVQLKWLDNANNERGYEIWRSTDGVNFKQINTIGENSTTYTNGKLVKGVLYYFRVRAFNDAGESKFTHTAEGIPLTPVSSAPPPTSQLPAPTGLSATSMSSTAVSLAWKDNASSETGYAIERSLDGTNFKQVNTVGANITTYTNGKLVTGTKYYYRVRAFDGSGDGAYSSIASVTPVTPPPVVTPPLTTPSSLKVSATSSSTIKLTWNDNGTTQTGYDIERGTDGQTFVQIDSISANVATDVSVNLVPSTKYYFRVRAFNATQTSGYSNIANTTTKSAPPVSSDPSHPFADGGAGQYATPNWYFDGVSVTLAVDPAKVIPILKTLHVGSVRIWLTRNQSWDISTGHEGLTAAAAYKAAGFRVMMVVGDDAVPTYAQANAFFTAVANEPNALKDVDLWEIGNEPNQPQFWKGTAQQYVDDVLKAALDAFHPLGATVVGAGPTWDVSYCQTLVTDGYLNYVDIANFHPYGSTPEQIYTRATGAIAAFAGKPVLFSEWNIRNTSGLADWAAKVDASRKLLATTGADSAFYFTLVVANTLGGPGGLINADYTPNEPFFDMFKNFGEDAITVTTPTT